MEPTIYTNDIVLCEHVTKSIMRGDIVIACSTNDPTVNVCKRVLAIAGDIIHMGGREMMIPTGYIWLQGDNLYNSTDSRNYGPIPLGLVRGRVLAKVWPLSKFTLFDKNPNLKP
ncbi:hypothetical protein AAG570_007998 [Ranatra chinensis]|uniref:Peptidase S26 domain-containing protein n=1 Tax=Ranatra chinensis TaxID=642074 RepID=A0ABD0XW47_9HEMI